MRLDDTMQPPGALASGRFFRTGYLPTYAAAVFLLVLVWAGAPGRPIDFSRAWRTASQFGAVQALLLALAVTLAAVLLQPLQVSIVRVLEGGFPRWLGSGLTRKVRVWRKNSIGKAIQQDLDKAAQVLDAPGTLVAAATAGKALSRNEALKLLQEAGAKSARLRSRFPMPDHAIRATALGNALAAMEDTAGAAYGLDAPVVWPLLYPVLSDPVRRIVDDLRDGVDAAVRLAATGALTAAAALGLLVWHSGWWTLLALAPLGIAVIAYAGAVRAAIAYGAAVHAAFDLHRFDLLRALHLPLPEDSDAERAGSRALSDFLRQGVPVPFTYADPGSSGTHLLSLDAPRKFRRSFSAGAGESPDLGDGGGRDFPAAYLSAACPQYSPGSWLAVRRGGRLGPLGRVDWLWTGQAARADGGPVAASNRFIQSCSRCQPSGRCKVISPRPWRANPGGDVDQVTAQRRFPCPWRRRGWPRTRRRAAGCALWQRRQARQRSREKSLMGDGPRARRSSPAKTPRGKPRFTQTSDCG